MAGPSDSRLPLGFSVALSSGTKVCDAGRTLVGGDRRGVLYLTSAAARMLRDDPIAASDAASAALVRRLLDRGYAHPVWSTPCVADDAVGDVTVVVPTQDRPGELRSLLSALPAAVPVVVVDDASDDPDAVAAVASSAGATVVAHGVNRGPAAARNTGLRAVRTPYVAFCDSDVVPAAGWLAVLRRHFADPALAVAAPRVLGPPRRPGDSWVERYEQARSSLDLGPTPAAVRPGGRVSYLPSACLLARVDALGRGFDESMRCGEDVDLVWRLIDQGWRVRYEPTATVRHRHRAAPEDWLRRKAFYGTSAAPLAEWHGDAVAPMVVAPWSLAVMLAMLAQRRWSAPFAGAAVAVAIGRTARRLRRSDRPVATASVLTMEGLVAVLWQTASALTRHYWPLAVPVALISRRLRRALALAAVAEGVADYVRVRPDLDPIRYVVAHRLDDLAYGAGLWTGCLRQRSVRALLPRVVGVWPGGARRT